MHNGNSKAGTKDGAGPGTEKGEEEQPSTTTGDSDPAQEPGDESDWRPDRRSVLAALGGVGAGLSGPGAGTMLADLSGAGTSRSRIEGTDAVPSPSKSLSDAYLDDPRRSIRHVVDDEACFYPEQSPELYGPTDVNAQSGNQSLTVGLNRQGTVTVFRWPRPSFYDQVKYKTSDRNEPRFGAYPNAGAFLGLVLETPATTETTWLREWDTHQQYAHDLSDAVVTEHRSDAWGMTVRVTDVVARDEDALVREVEVRRDDGSPVTDASLVAFANVNPVVSKHARSPTRDWCEEEANTDRAFYDPDLDAVVNAKTDVDESTGDDRTVAVAVGFGSESVTHQVGGDAYEPTASPDGEAGPTQDAYDDVADGVLRGNDEYVGQTTTALLADLDLTGGRCVETVGVAAGADVQSVRTPLSVARERRPAALRVEKRNWFRDLLTDAPLPDTDDETILSVAKRALVTLVANYDPDSGAIVASIATQSPYAEDWVRDGAYFNRALERIGLQDWVEKRNRWYASLQQRADDPRPSQPDTPPGNWAMNYYADGVAGGPIPYEIDETGYGLWTLWDHYRETGDRDYLQDVYPAIRRAADYLVECEDPDTGLHCPAPEDDHPDPSQTVIGAAPVWLGLRSAVEAARALDRPADATRWAARRDELGRAIDDHLWDAEERDYCVGLGEFARAVAALAWPAEFKPADHTRMASHLQECWERVEPAFREPEAGALEWGLYETKALLPLAKASSQGSSRMQQIERGLRWIAHEHATDDTHVLGEVWLVEDDDVVSAVSQPHTWEQVLFYLTALEVWPPG